MSRVLALVGAVVLIIGAVAARNAIDDDGSGDGGTDGDVLVVRCIPELEEACRAIDRPMDLVIEDPDATMAAVAAGTDVDAWVTFDPWPAIATFDDEDSTYEGVVGVASDDLEVVVRTARIPDGCDDLVTWTCLVDGLGDSVALPGAGSALRPLVVGHAAVDFFGPGVVANDLADPALTDRLHALDASARDPLNDMRVGLPEPAATGILDVQLASLGGRAADFTTSPGAVEATVAVVVSGPRAGRITGESGFTTALQRLGWTVQAGAATAGLPPAGVLIALLEETS